MPSGDDAVMVVRRRMAAAGVVVSLASAAWIDAAAWPTYAVFFTFAFVFSFVWLDSEAPASVAYMAMATAFVYIGGLPILFFELLARLVAYPLIFLGARLDLIALPRPLRPLVQPDRARARAARLDLAAMLGLATIGSTIRVAVLRLMQLAGIDSLVGSILLGEAVAYSAMGVLSVRLPLPTADYVVAAPWRLPEDDARVDAIFTGLAVVLFLVPLIAYGWLKGGLPAAAGWSIATLGGHYVVQLLIRRRRLLHEQNVALDRATRSLAEKQAELEAFTYAVTHDVKLPVNGITLTAALLLRADRYRDPEAVREDTGQILRLSRQTETMIADLLRMARIVSQPEPIEAVDLGALTAEAVDAVRAQMAARGVHIDVTAPLPAVRGQPTKLRHVVNNLIENAIRFVPAGTGNVDVSATCDGGAVVLSVRDNGVGIPAEYQDAIFDMFRRVPNGGGEEVESGMGLAIVKRIVERHGGTVEVESTPGSGSVFRVRLPGDVQGHES